MRPSRQCSKPSDPNEPGNAHPCAATNVTILLFQSTCLSNRLTVVAEEYMNDFTNPNKRGFQLRKGAKNLLDILQPKLQKVPNNFQKVPNNWKCDYCGAPAIAVSTCYAIPGVMNEETRRWCERCQLDLAEFAARPENSLPDDLDIDDEAAMERASQQLADRQRRQEEFMRRRVKERPQ